MKYVCFSEQEKAAMFDEIAAHFYDANFGMTSKTELELLMFHYYMEKLKAASKRSDGTTDYNKCSDYKISRELGITQQRVRNLKVKEQLVFQKDENDWKNELANLTKHARYDKVTKKVTLNIPDPNLFLDIQNFIEERGAYVEKQLNGKVLQLRAEYYIDLVISLEPGESQKSIVRSLKKLFRDEGKLDDVFDEKNIGESLMNTAINLSTVAANLSTMISPQNVIGGALLSLLNHG